MEKVSITVQSWYDTQSVQPTWFPLVCGLGTCKDQTEEGFQNVSETYAHLPLCRVHYLPLLAWSCHCPTMWRELCLLYHEGLHTSLSQFLLLAINLLVAVLLQGAEHLSLYTFNTHQAKHTFCNICGVQSFYTPRSNPDGKGVAVHCLDAGTVNNVTITTFDGQNWEKSMEEDPSIKARSKEMS